MSQDVAENDTGTFRCRGEGIPEPTIKWLINGVAVTSKFISRPTVSDACTNCFTLETVYLFIYYKIVHTVQDR